ncbi:MAG TPA: LysE family translocator [Rhabdochlamydiaceae bacterium]|nr:LysE family translocator [Rhabdochlamydiaceae bacterium]
MSLSLLFAMFSFSLAMSISPGPVNMIILSSGVDYGAKKTMPYVSGATIGFTLLLLFVGFFFNKLIEAYPFLLTFISIAGVLYIIYMGYKIASSHPEIEVKKTNIPKFYEGFLLQWLNPKAWIACVSGASIFSSHTSYGPFLIFASIYFIVCYVSLAIWAILGEKIAFLLKSRSRLRLFNLLTGLLLIVTAIYIGYTQFK